MNKVIVIPTEKERTARLQDLIMALHNLRYWTKYWHAFGGSRANERKKYWEKKADDILTELGLSQHNNIYAVWITKD